MEVNTIPDLPYINTGIPFRVTTMGNFVEVQYISNRNQECPIQMLPDGEYLIKDTGEIKQKQTHDKRTDQEISLKRTFRNLRRTINANCTDSDYIRFITLTYAENMTDNDRLYDDFRMFNMRFQYWCKSLGYGKPEYIAVVEPQARGAWHMHVLYIWPGKAPYIPNDKLRDLWGFGFVNIKSLKDCDNVGAYLTAYLCDADVSEGLDCSPLLFAGFRYKRFSIS